MDGELGVPRSSDPPRILKNGIIQTAIRNGTRNQAVRLFTSDVVSLPCRAQVCNPRLRTLHGSNPRLRAASCRCCCSLLTPTARVRRHELTAGGRDEDRRDETRRTRRAGRDETRRGGRRGDESGERRRDESGDGRGEERRGDERRREKTRRARRDETRRDEMSETRRVERGGESREEAREEHGEERGDTLGVRC